MNNLFFFWAKLSNKQKKYQIKFDLARSINHRRKFDKKDTIRIGARGSLKSERMSRMIRKMCMQSGKSKRLEIETTSSRNTCSYESA